MMHVYFQYIVGMLLNWISLPLQQMPGCFRVLTAADIPKGGENNFLPKPEYRNPEKVLLACLSNRNVYRVKLHLCT